MTSSNCSIARSARSTDSEVAVTYLTDDINDINKEGDVFPRACQTINLFLDKYRLLNEDYRVSAVSLERNFYFATCHTSALRDDELNLSVPELFDRLQAPRTFLALSSGTAQLIFCGPTALNSLGQEHR